MRKKQGCVNVSFWLPVDMVEEMDAMTVPTTADHERVSRNVMVRKSLAPLHAVRPLAPGGGSLMAVEVATSHLQITDASGNPLSGARIYV